MSKLIREFAQLNGVAHRKPADVWESRRMLVRKMLEEIGELATSDKPHETIEHLVDVMECVVTYAETHSITVQELLEMAAVKRERKGSLRYGFIVELTGAPRPFAPKQ